jgi:hypothetical protein
LRFALCLFADEYSRVVASCTRIPNHPHMAKPSDTAKPEQPSSRLETLTQGNVALMGALQRRGAKDSFGSLKFLAAIRPAEWLELVHTHGTPEGSPLTPTEYAAALASNVERHFPTASLAAHLADGRRLGQIPALKGVARFLWDHPGFDLVTANLNATTRLADPRSGPASPQLVAGLRSLQRLHELGATWDETAALLDAGYHSAADVAAAEPTELNTRLAGRIKPEQRILALQHRAKTLQKAASRRR